MADTPWTESTKKKLYLQSGQFTSTVKTSQYIGDVDTQSTGISYDGTNSPWCGNTDKKLYLQSGQFTSTIKDSVAIHGIDDGPKGISWDGANTPWCGEQFDKLYLQSGQFTSTLKDSEYIGAVEGLPQDISFSDPGNTPYTGKEGDKLYLQSGQFTSTLKTSQYIGSVATIPVGISYDGTNTPWMEDTASDKLHLQSGQFTSTLKTSEDISGISTSPEAICTNDISGRLGGVTHEKSVSNTINFIQTLSRIREESVNNVLALNQALSRIQEESVNNVLALNQALNRTQEESVNNTLSLTQIISRVHEESVNSALSLTQTLLASLINVPSPPPGNPTLNRFIRRTLYSLKRQYGGRVDIYQLNDAETDYVTGVKTVDKTVYTVRKCIVLPVKIAREVVQAITQISANKMFVYGGSYDAGTRMFIIDTRDMPNNYEFTNDDWIIYDGRRYDIKSIEEFEQHTAWTIVGKEVKGVKPEQVFFAHLTSKLELEQEASN